MKKLLFVPAILLGMFLFVQPASAAFLSSVDYVGWLAAPENIPSATLWDLQPNSLTDLNTPFSMANSGMNVLRRGSAIYYTTEAGIVKQGIGQAETRVLRDGTGYEFVVGQGTKMLINNTPYNRPFIFDIFTKKARSLKPRMKAVHNADFANGGKTLAILANNMKDVQKLFVSQGDPATTQQIDLPTGATKCTKVALSPDGTRISLICEWSIAGVGADTSVFTANVNGQTVSNFRRKTIDTLTPISIGWTSNARLIVMGYEPESLEQLLDISVYEYIVDRRAKVVNSTRLIDNMVAENYFDGQPSVFFTPQHIERNGRAGFYYTIAYLGGDEVDTSKAYWGTLVGYYNFATDTDTLLIHDLYYNVLATKPNYDVTAPIL